MNKSILLTALLTISIGLSAQTDHQPTASTVSSTSTPTPESVKAHNKPGGIQWMTLGEALDKTKIAKKKIIIDFFTDWCGWCKKLDATTYQDPKVIAMVNKYYYPVKFNAESDGPVKYKGVEYSIKASGIRSTHEFAVMILKGHLGYPTTTFLGNNQEFLSNEAGYLNASDMVLKLKFFGEDIDKIMTFDDFKAQELGQ